MSSLVFTTVSISAVILLGSVAFGCEHDRNGLIIHQSCSENRALEAVYPAYDCQELRRFQVGDRSIGVQKIAFAPGKSPEKVYCDAEGWTVIQSRGQYDNSIYYFLRDWEAYEKGFGQAGAEQWLGLENIHQITQRKNYTLRIKLTDVAGVKGAAFYNHFRLGDKASLYKLELGTFLGPLSMRGAQDIGDSFNTGTFGAHTGQSFSTIDADHDASNDNCAELYTGAWWYAGCHGSNLNGVNFNSKNTTTFATGINWSTWKGFTHSVREVEMAIKGAEK